MPAPSLSRFSVQQSMPGQLDTWGSIKSVRSTFSVLSSLAPCRCAVFCGSGSGVETFKQTCRARSARWQLRLESRNLTYKFSLCSKYTLADPAWKSQPFCASVACEAQRGSSGSKVATFKCRCNTKYTLAAPTRKSQPSSTLASVAAVRKDHFGSRAPLMPYQLLSFVAHSCFAMLFVCM